MSFSSLNNKVNKHLGYLQDTQGYQNILVLTSKAMILNHYLHQIHDFPESLEKKYLTERILDDLKIIKNKAPENLGDFSQQMLQRAIEDNDRELLESLIALKPELVKLPIVNKGKKSALILAAEQGRVDLIKLLIEVQGIDLNFGCNRTALDEAVSQNNITIVQLLLQAGAKPKQGTLQIACSNGFLTLAQELIKANHEQANHPFDLENILMQTITHGQLELIRFLVNELGTTINFEETPGSNLTPLVLAIQYKEPEIARFLTEAGADIASAKLYFKMNDLSFAAFLGDKASIDTILSTKAGQKKLNIADKEGCTALTRAVQSGHEELVKCFIKAGAKVNSMQKNGNTPLIDAVRMRNKTLVEVLLCQESCDIETIDEHNYYSARELALSNKDMSILLALDNCAELRQTKQKEKQMKTELGKLLDSCLSDINKKDNLRIYFLGFFQKSLTPRKKAIEALQQALNGEMVNLSAHMATLRHGNLGKKIRAFIRAGNANCLVGNEVRTVRAFVASLHVKVNHRTLSKQISK